MDVLEVAKSAQTENDNSTIAENGLVDYDSHQSRLSQLHLIIAVPGRVTISSFNEQMHLQSN